MDSISNKSEDDETIFYDQLKLPWQENFWKIKITHANAPNEVWAVLADTVDLLVRARNRTQKLSLIAAETILTDEIYLCCLPDGMQRVKVIETFIIADHLHCNCFFIDTGKSDTVNSENLYVCGFEFGKIAPQAICFNLNGFEELQNCPHITNVFNAWLNGKYFQGCVSITENQYRMQSYRDVTKIPITLFSSYPKLSLLRPMLMEHIGETLPKPEFSFDFTNAKVTHIEANGIIYFHLDRSSVKYIDSQIENTVKEQRHSAKRQMLKKSTKIGLIRDNKQNRYFRARITANNNGSTFQCYFMDYGFTKSVAHFDIFVIDEDSILSHYPSQAVPAKLNSVSVFDEIVLQRLHSILPVGTNVKVKAVKLNDKYPMVIVHKREMNINELIHMEVELRDFDIPLPYDSLPDE